MRRTERKLETTVYRKNTNTGECLNYKSICPERYKKSVISNYLHRAYSICSNWTDLTTELQRIKQILVNNNFPNSIIDSSIKSFIDRKMENPIDRNSQEKQETIKLFYKNQMTGTYKMTEKEINQIITQNVKPNSDAKLKLFIYYKNKKLRQLFIKNNPQKSNESHHVIYKYTCDQAQCTAAHANYIGHTTTTLKERFKQHSSIKKHFQSIHKRNITGSEMMKNVEVLCRASDKRTLSILEALMIQKLKPLINLQVGDFNRTLKIFA